MKKTNSLSGRSFKHLFAILLLLSAAAVTGAQDDNRVQATWRVQQYDITASLPATESDRNLSAKATLNLKNVSAAPATTLSLRISPAAEITSVNINGSSADFTKREEKIATGTLQRIVVRTPGIAAGATVTAVVDYKLNIKENSGVGALSPIGSQFLPLSYWYPTPNSWYFAQGADYAPVRLQITAPGQNVIASGADSPSGAFDQKLPVQPFFLAGNWDKIDSNGVTVFAPKGSVSGQSRGAEIAALAVEARNFVAGLLGPAPAIPVRLVSVKRGSGFSSGGTILIDDGVFRRSKIDSLTAANIADAVAKLWIGSREVAGSGQGAVREGLTRFIATQFLESKYGKEVADVERMRQRTAYAAVSKRDSPVTVVSPLDDYYYAVVANKGAMIWRILEKRIGKDDFYRVIAESFKDGAVELGEIRTAFSGQKELMDYLFDEVTDTNLLVGLPQPAGGETKVALRNTGGTDAVVEVTAFSANGEKLSAPTTVRARSYGEVVFKTPNKIVRVEVDSEKLYPQTDYSDDVAPRELTESDLLLAVKRSFDKQDFAGAEKSARIVLRGLPRYDDVRILLARSLAAQGKSGDAEKEFRSILQEPLPSARSLAWANLGLAEIASKSGQAAQAAKLADEAIIADGDYGASLAARTLRSNLNAGGAADDTVKAFFAQWDKAAMSNRKADLEALVVPGEVSKFASGISGSTEQWQTQVRSVDRLDANTVLVETALNIKLLTKDPEAGTAVYRLSRVGNSWKLSSVDVFEVR